MEICGCDFTNLFYFWCVLTTNFIVKLAMKLQKKRRFYRFFQFVMHPILPKRILRCLKRPTRLFLCLAYEISPDNFKINF